MQRVVDKFQIYKIMVRMYFNLFPPLYGFFWSEKVLQKFF